jgi:hypothetical protein
LEFALPAGYEWQDDGNGIELTADRQVTDVLRLVFDKFDELGSSRQVALWLREQHIKLPRRKVSKPGGAVCWVEATRSAV